MINLITGGFILSTYLSPTNREGTQPSQFIPPVHQGFIRPDPQQEFGDKMDRNGDTLKMTENTMQNQNGNAPKYHNKEQRFDNMHLQDIYYNLPRAL
jgi:hypothetical protein